MHKQLKPYWCGPAAIQNALKAKGKRVSQKRVAEYCETTVDGTTETMLMTGLDLLGFSYGYFSVNGRTLARTSLDTAITNGEPVILSVEDWEHWITVIAVGPRYALVDPEVGTIALLSWIQLERKWRAAARIQTHPNDRTYYGLSIGGKNGRRR